MKPFSYANDKVKWIKGKISCPLAAIGSFDSCECLTLVSITFKSNGNKTLHIH